MERGAPPVRLAAGTQETNRGPDNPGPRLRRRYESACEVGQFAVSFRSKFRRSARTRRFSDVTSVNHASGGVIGGGLSGGESTRVPVIFAFMSTTYRTTVPFSVVLPGVAPIVSVWSPNADFCSES